MSIINKPCKDCLYKCKKPLTVSKYDDNGFFIENDVINIKVGTIFEVSETENLFIAAKPAIRLENSSCWIEVYPETLELYFEKILNEDKE